MLFNELTVEKANLMEKNQKTFFYFWEVDEVQRAAILSLRCIEKVGLSLEQNEPGSKHFQKFLGSLNSDDSLTLPKNKGQRRASNDFYNSFSRATAQFTGNRKKSSPFFVKHGFNALFSHEP